MIDELRHSHRRVILAVCAAYWFSAAQGATAQSTPASQLDVIIVSAQKRSENIQDVPIAVSAISSQLLDDTHATQLIDIAGYLPALQINSSGTPGQTSISIRGIAPVGPVATVATYIDDTPVGSSSAYGGGIAFALDLLPYDIERLEILRGPQGTLYGASSMGGLLKYVLSTPLLDQFEEHVGADMFGMSDAGKAGGGVRARISGPLVEGKLGFTASYAEERTPGFIDNSVTGRKDQNGFRQRGARLGLWWRPADNLSVKLNALYQQVNADGDASNALDAATLQALIGARRDNNLTDQPFEKNIQYFSAVAEYGFPKAYFTSASSFSVTRTDQSQDDSYSFGVAFPAFGIPAGRSQNHYQLHLEKSTQEFRLQSLPNAKLEWLGGVFATYENSSNFQSPSALDITGVSISGLDPIYVAELPSIYAEGAAFADLTYHPTNELEIAGGLRYSQNHQVFSEIARSPIFAAVDLRDQKSAEGVATYSVGARYRVSEKVMTYLRIASGYRPGGPNLAIPGIPPASKSDTLTNYEVGLKSQFLENRILFDADAFYIAWNDIQILANGMGFSYGTNGGKAKSQGIEANSSFHPIDNLALDATFAYVDAVLTEDVPVIAGRSGDRLPNIPRYSGSLRASYSRALSESWVGSVGAGLWVVGQRYSDVNHAVDSRSLPGYRAIDFNASVSHERYTLRIFAKNVADEHAYLTYNPLINQATGNISQIEATVLHPRLIGLSLDAKF